MSTPIVICDDSSFARKQMARALPKQWDVNVSFAEHGKEAIEAIQAGKADILFLDLNMPIMDGYEVLEEIRRTDLPTMVIVVSGDIQPEAHERVMGYGALAFIKKPIDSEILGRLLTDYGILSAATTRDNPVEQDIDFEVGQLDCYQEIANIAMGQAADLLARLLDAFIKLPVPRIKYIEGHELRTAFENVDQSETISAVCQGFIGAGIAGEAVLTFNDSSMSDIAELMRFEDEIDDRVEIELMMDIASVLIGACLSGISKQLDIHFSQGHPLVLGQHIAIDRLLEHNASRWEKTLAIEIAYRIENRNVNCDLLLLFSEDSLDNLNQLASYIEL